MRSLFSTAPTPRSLSLRVSRDARPSLLLVIADGPRPAHQADVNRCAAARAIIEQVDWPCEVRTNYAIHNMGCGARLASGLHWVFEQVEEAIILEDDCVPQADFFSFCAALLHRYRDDERIMLISGSNLIDHLDIPESYLFSRWYNIWGWATWRRAWQLYDFEMGDWAAMRQTKLVEQAYPDKYVSRYLRKSFDLLLARKINTWDIQWFYTCLRSSGLCIAPPRQPDRKHRDNRHTHTGRPWRTTSHSPPGYRPLAPSTVGACTSCF